MDRRSEWIGYTQQQAAKAAEYRESAGRWDKVGNKVQATLNNVSATRLEGEADISYEDWLEMYG